MSDDESPILKAAAAPPADDKGEWQDVSKNLAKSFTIIPDSKLVPVERSELRAGLEKDPVASSLLEIKDEQGKELPIFIVPRIGQMPEDKPTVALNMRDNGTPYLLINEAAHEWTTAYVKEHIMPRDADLRSTKSIVHADDLVQMLDSLKPQSPEGVATFDKMKHNIQKFQEAVKNASVDMVPAGEAPRDVTIVLATPGMQQTYSPAGSMISAEGNAYIVMTSPNILSDFLSDDKTAAMARFAKHEMGHIYNGDLTPEGMIKNRDLKTAQLAEFKADLKAGDPGLGTDFTGMLSNFASNLAPKSEGRLPNFEELKDASKTAHSLIDPAHPSMLDRISALEIQDALKTGLEKRHPPTTAEEKTEQAQWIMQKIMKQAETGTIPESATLKALTAQMQGMKKLPMQDVEHEPVKQQGLPDSGHAIPAERGRVH